jgi:hypothetical protein
MKAGEALDWGDPEDLQTGRWNKIKGSPLIRNDFNTRSKDDASNVRPVSASHIKDTVRNVVKASGIAEPKDDQEHLSRYQRRNKQPAAYGLRKFFDTTLINNRPRLDYIFKELLMQHKAKLDNSYYDMNDKKSQHEILFEYLKAVNDLTINDEARLKVQVKEKDQELQYLKFNIQAQFNNFREEIKKELHDEK